MLALSSTRNNDRVGLLIFTDVVEHFVPPRKGRRHALRMIRDVLAFSPERHGTSIAPALDFAGRLLRHRSIVFVLSDFQVGAQGVEPLQRTLKLIGRRHDVVAIRIADPLEAELPNAGLLVLTDPESGERTVVDTGSKAVRVEYARAVRGERDAVRKLFRQQGIDEIEVSTHTSYIGPLLAFFRKRERRRG